ncbi:MAG TPA: phage holin family protein [Burkholderiales bacterium]|nr:phage holin family protein [Burkholderiales bacterium]
MQRANPVVRFVLFWAVNTLALWVAGQVFHSVRFDGWQALLVAGLLFGIVNATLKPILVVLTAPITVLTLGLFLLVINALMLLLTVWLVHGFHLQGGFWRAVLVALFISVFSFLVNQLFSLSRPR